MTPYCPSIRQLGLSSADSTLRILPNSEYMTHRTCDDIHCERLDEEFGAPYFGNKLFQATDSCKTAELLKS